MGAVGKRVEGSSPKNLYKRIKDLFIIIMGEGFLGPSPYLLWKGEKRHEA